MATIKTGFIYSDGTGCRVYVGRRSRRDGLYVCQVFDPCGGLPQRARFDRHGRRVRKGRVLKSRYWLCLDPEGSRLSAVESGVETVYN